MKKALLLALCLILAGLLAVNGTFATEATQTVQSLFRTFTKWIALLGEEAVQPATNANFNVAFVYPDSNAQSSPVLMPGRTINHRLAVQNQSATNAAYFCVAFAVQESIADQLHFTKAAGYTWREDCYNSITIGNTPYRLSVALYNGQLAAGATSADVITHVSLDADITTEQLSSVNEQFMQMKLMAVDVDTFSSVAEATAESILTQALGLREADFNPFK